MRNNSLRFLFKLLKNPGFPFSLNSSIVDGTYRSFRNIITTALLVYTYLMSLFQNHWVYILCGGVDRKQPQGPHDLTRRSVPDYQG